jgi:hypothetical protein
LQRCLDESEETAEIASFLLRVTELQSFAQDNLLVPLWRRLQLYRTDLQDLVDHTVRQPSRSLYSVIAKATGTIISSNPALLLSASRSWGSHTVATYIKRYAFGNQINTQFNPLVKTQKDQPQSKPLTEQFISAMAAEFASHPIVQTPLPPCVADKQARATSQTNGLTSTDVWGCSLCGVVCVKPFDAKVPGGKERLGVSLNIENPILPKVVCNNCKQTEFTKLFALSGNITTARLSAASKSTVSIVVCVTCARVATRFQIHGLDPLCCQCFADVQRAYRTSTCVCGNAPAEDAVPFVAKTGDKLTVYKGCASHKWILPTEVYLTTPDLSTFKSLLAKSATF